MAIGDMIRGVVNEVLAEILKKATGTTKRRKRKSAASGNNAKSLPASKRAAKPAKRQTSKRKTVGARSKARSKS